jgi:hypothetical protein
MMPLTYFHNQCYFNNYINVRNAYKDRGLKLVSGSLAFNGWFEYGGRHWTKADFAAKMKPYSTDSHSWLEDADGNVYDCITDGMQFVSVTRTGKRLGRKGVVEGVSKADLAKDGLEYVAADRDTQAMLFLHVLPLCKYYYEMIKSGKAGNKNGMLVTYGHAIGLEAGLHGLATGQFVGISTS